jgi:hypothetical protein
VVWSKTVSAEAAELMRVGDISIDDGIARFGQSSYPISQISAVSIAETSKQRGFAWRAVRFAAFTMWVSGIVVGFQAIKGGTSIALAAISLFAIAYGIGKIGKRMRQDAISRTYHLVIGTTGGQSQAASSADLLLLTELRDLIEAKIAQR